MTLLSIEHVEPLGQWEKFFDGNIVISRDKCNLMDFRILHSMQQVLTKMGFLDDMNIIVFLLACYDYPVADLRSYDKSCGAINHPISATCLLDRQSDQGNVSMHHQGMSSCIDSECSDFIINYDLTNSLFCTQIGTRQEVPGNINTLSSP